MPTNIVIFSDGTGNSAIKDRGTNVFKLYEALDLTYHPEDPSCPPQVAFYDDGVGTEDLKFLRAMGGAFGLGLKRNILQLYTGLCRTYVPGDKIFLFGFSRGAFTVRMLAGFILRCGIVDRSKYRTDAELDAAVRQAYRQYRVDYQAWFDKLVRFIVRLNTPLPADHLHHSKIQFIGVWDTVAAVAVPSDTGAKFFNKIIHQFRFPNLRVDEGVCKVCHAVAIDDERKTFHPEICEENPKAPDRIEQVWFAGVHSNVGGGYPKQGMSLVSLDWMMTRAYDMGLRYQDGAHERIQAACNVDDKLYDSRSGLQIMYRYKPRPIQELCKNSVSPKVHISVLRRIARATEMYAPGNLPPTLELVTTRDSDAPGGGRDPDALDRLADRVCKKLAEQQDALTQASPWILTRRATHHTFLYLLLALPAIAKFSLGRVPEGTTSVSPDDSILTAAHGAVTASLEPIPLGVGPWILGNIVDPYFNRPWLLLAILLTLLSLYGLGLLARLRMQTIYSRFWRETLTPEDLRDAYPTGIPEDTTAEEASEENIDASGHSA